ncbi:sensor histidine kinase [Ramlibacter humi]|uniref:histidine kinase n=1 Tax=Ramlibacter humi TaxID=2530451 RepID=A0A4Z0BNV9_9BURK|nr:ATP-binding protein [Ramlibacter humi]TFZ00114.1 histidine kinase [Ramlibacter humi]
MPGESPNALPHRWRWWLLLAALAALALGFWVSLRPVVLPGGDILTIDHAQAQLQPDGLPAYDGPVDLNRRWDTEFPGRGGRARYEVALPPHAGTEPMALLFSRVGSQVEVRVNGATVHVWGTLGDPAYDAAKFPVMALVPAALLHAGRPNELRVDVTLQPMRLGGLSVFHYGPHDAIERIYDNHRRWREIAFLVFAVGLAGMSAFTGALWLRQRVPLYGWYSLGALFGVLRIVERAAPAVPVPWPWIGALGAICYLFHMVLMCRFSVLATGPAPRATDRILDLGTLFSAATAMLAYGLHWPWLLTLGLCATAAVSYVCMWTVGRRAWTSGDRKAWVLAAVLGASIAAGAHDLVFVRLSGANGLHATYLQHAMFGFAPVMGWLIAERYSRTVAGFEALNQDLSRRVGERERQLKAAFDAMREQQHHQSVADERQRIMREIHDGVGSQLVALLNMVERPQADSRELREHVQLALDEMRMAVDSLQPANDDLATVLATLRYRLQPRLEAAGIAVAWEVAELPERRELSPHVVMHVQRILLEAFTNVLKHARATHIAVRGYLDGEGTAVILQIADNGAGFRGDAQPEGAGRRRGGRGLDNMRSRAAAIGAHLRIEPSPAGGACVTLALKVEKETGP